MSGTSWPASRGPAARRSYATGNLPVGRATGTLCNHGEVALKGRPADQGRSTPNEGRPLGAQSAPGAPGSADRGSGGVVVGAEHRSHAGHGLTGFEVHDPHAGGVAALAGDLPDGHADERAPGVDHEDLVVDADHERGDHEALLGGELDAPHALTTPALHVEVLELGALAVAGVGDDQHGDVVAAGVEAHHLVAGAELHADRTSTRLNSSH